MSALAANAGVVLAGSKVKLRGIISTIIEISMLKPDSADAESQLAGLCLEAMQLAREVELDVAEVLGENPLAYIRHGRGVQS